MHQAQRIIWNGTVQGLALTEQLHAAANTDCQALSETYGLRDIPLDRS